MCVGTRWGGVWAWGGGATWGFPTQSRPPSPIAFYIFRGLSLARWTEVNQTPIVSLPVTFATEWYVYWVLWRFNRHWFNYSDLMGEFRGWSYWGSGHAKWYLESPLHMLFCTRAPRVQVSVFVFTFVEPISILPQRSNSASYKVIVTTHTSSIPSTAVVAQVW